MTAIKSSKNKKIMCKISTSMDTAKFKLAFGLKGALKVKNEFQFHTASYTTSKFNSLFFYVKQKLNTRCNTLCYSCINSAFQWKDEKFELNLYSLPFILQFSNYLLTISKKKFFFFFDNAFIRVFLFSIGIRGEKGKLNLFFNSHSSFVRFRRWLGWVN